jgi:hypothetical protein
MRGNPSILEVGVIHKDIVILNTKCILTWCCQDAFLPLSFALFENSSFAGAETAVFKATAV